MSVPRAVATRVLMAAISEVWSAAVQVGEVEHLAVPPEGEALPGDVESPLMSLKPNTTITAIGRNGHTITRLVNSGRPQRRRSFRRATAALIR